MSRRRLRPLAVVVAMALVGLGACGRSVSTGSSGGGTGGPGDAAARTGPGFDGTTLTLGVLTPQTGLAAAAGNPLTVGNEVFFERVNAQGGIAGRFKVRLLAADTKYDPADAVTLYGQLKGEVAMFVQILGTAVVDALKGQLQADEILAQPATLDAFWVHEPSLAPIGAPYQIQIINALDYAVRELDARGKKVCALTKDDAYGAAVMQGYDFGLDALGLSTTADATFKQGDADFTAQINRLQGEACDIVALATLPTETGPILQAAATRRFAPKWIGTSPSWNVVLGGTAAAPSPLAPYFEENFLLASEGYDWGDESNPPMKQQMEDLRTYRPDQAPNGFVTFGWNEAWAVAQILEFAAQQGDLTQKGIYDASHKIDKLTFGGGWGDYVYGDPSDRDPPRATSIFKVDVAEPNGLDALEVNVVSPPAREFTFP